MTQPILITFEGGAAVMRSGMIDARGIGCECCVCEPFQYPLNDSHKGIAFVADVIFVVTIGNCQGTFSVSVRLTWDDGRLTYYGEDTVNDYTVEAQLELDGALGRWRFGVFIESPESCCLIEDPPGTCLASRAGVSHGVTGCQGCGSCLPPAFILIDDDNNDFGNTAYDGGLTIDALLTREEP